MIKRINGCPKCGRPLEKRPVQYVLRRGEYFYAFEGVPACICPACDWRTIVRADITVMKQALGTGVMSAAGMLNVPLFAFSEAQQVVENREPTEASGAGLVKDAPHNELTGQVIGWAMDVHNEFGPGHREVVYHRALAARVDKECVAFEEEPNITIENQDGVLVGLYHPDFVIKDVLIVEIKAHGWSFTNDEIAQVIDYFAGTDCDVALLFNFGRQRLEWKRLFPPKRIQEHRRKKCGRPLE
jgi:GxxExxY protein